MKTRRLMIIASTLLIGMLISGCDQSANQYTEAQNLMAEESYTEAAEIFKELGDYEDSADQYNLCLYNSGTALMNDKQYEEAAAVFEQISDYEDAAEQLAYCEHEIALENDTSAPTVTGLEEGQTVEVEYNTPFNLKTYLEENISIEDDLSGEITDYQITTNSPEYNLETGELDTTVDGKSEFILTAEDEAKNKTTINFSTYVDATLHITADTEFPIIVYDGEMGTYQINSMNHYSDAASSPEYLEGYVFELELENKTEKEVNVAIGEAYLNDYRIYCYMDEQYIAPGKKGIHESVIYEEDIDEKMQDFSVIECKYAIYEPGENKGSVNDIYLRPLIIDRDAIALN